MSCSAYLVETYALTSFRSAEVSLQATGGGPTYIQLTDELATLQLFSIDFLAVMSDNLLGGQRRAAGVDMPKRTMTLNLTEEEMQVLDDLCAKKGLNKTALMRQALRLYQAIDVRLERGEKILFENEQTKEKSELMML